MLVALVLLVQQPWGACEPGVLHKHVHAAAGSGPPSVSPHTLLDACVNARALSTAPDIIWQKLVVTSTCQMMAAAVLKALVLPHAFSSLNGRPAAL